MSTVAADTPLWQTDLYMVVFGAGLGMNMQSIVLAMQNAVDARDMGVTTSAVTFFRQVGGSLGTAVFLSIPVLERGQQHHAQPERGRHPAVGEGPGRHQRHQPVEQPASAR